MNPQQAIELIDNVAAQANVPRHVHAQVIAAVAVLKQALAPKDDE